LEVVSGRLAFGAGLELGRLFEAEVEGVRVISDEIIFTKMRAVQSRGISVLTLRKEIDSIIKHFVDVAEGTTFDFIQYKSIQELLAEEARRSSGAHQTMLMHQVDTMILFARVVREHPDLLSSDMGIIYQANIRDLFMSYISHIEIVAGLLRDRRVIDELTKRRAGKAIKRVRAAVS
jgi:hypothetical protein